VKAFVAERYGQDGIRAADAVDGFIDVGRAACGDFGDDFRGGRVDVSMNWCRRRVSLQSSRWRLAPKYR